MRLMLSELIRHAQEAIAEEGDMEVEVEGFMYHRNGLVTAEWEPAYHTQATHRDDEEGKEEVPVFRIHGDMR